ncbi:unnamed protein product [Phytomonas sp. EM1]|nr:unnamed protein product [Phytomonas sp. EM1]|eukprot:CCW64820.1 unnamed protein product [Phytomonas sp. isolate EM1]
MVLHCSYSYCGLIAVHMVADHDVGSGYNYMLFLFLTNIGFLYILCVNQRRWRDGALKK